MMIVEKRNLNEYEQVEIVSLENPNDTRRSMVGDNE